jgi:hypothetical protein
LDHVEILSLGRLAREDGLFSHDLLDLGQTTVKSLFTESSARNGLARGQTMDASLVDFALRRSCELSANTIPRRRSIMPHAPLPV